jgi:hypothetical protein
MTKKSISHLYLGILFSFPLPSGVGKSGRLPQAHGMWITEPKQIKRLVECRVLIFE